jgi:ABC-type lipoprotein release transport system permease subunit
MLKDDIPLIITILGGIGGWTTAIVICTIWLTHQFRRMEKIIYREIGILEDMVDGHNRRLDRLEYHAFGFNFPNLSPRPKDTQGSPLVGGDDL